MGLNVTQLKNNIRRTHVLIALGSVLILCLCVLAYTLLYGQVSKRQIGTPEHFVGGLTALPEDAPLVTQTEVIELKDGDTLDLEATIVVQEVGNKMIKRLAYNGQIPGPVLKVERGSRITVNLTNNLDMETTLHSHGLRGDWRFDGTPGMSQDPIEIGETYTYQLDFPDAGVYWYHPHIREDYQQELGLYGNFIVSEEGYWNEADKEAYLILDDMLEDADFDPDMSTHVLMGRYGDRLLINDREDFQLEVTQGEITRVFLTDVANTRTFDIAFPGASMKLVGGDNGRVEHEEFVENTILAPSERSVVELLYDKPGTYAIEHHGAPIGTVVVKKGDTDKSSQFSQLRSNPSDYAQVRNNFTAYLRAQPDKRLRLDMVVKGVEKPQSLQDLYNEDGTITMMGFDMTEEQAIEHCGIMPQMSECDILMPAVQNADEIVMLDGKEMTRAQARQYCQLTPEKEGCAAYLSDGAMTMASHMHPDGIEWEDQMEAINEVSSNDTIEWVLEDQDTGLVNDQIMWSFNQGDMVKVRIFNDDSGLHPMQHPIHFHGQRFVVLGRDGVANNNMQWKDTELIRMGETVDLLVEMSNPGKWMTHCHIAEHLSANMMLHFEVLN